MESIAIEIGSLEKAKGSAALYPRIRADGSNERKIHRHKPQQILSMRLTSCVPLCKH